MNSQLPQWFINTHFQLCNYNRNKLWQIPDNTPVWEMIAPQSPTRKFSYKVQDWADSAEQQNLLKLYYR